MTSRQLYTALVPVYSAVDAVMSGESTSASNTRSSYSETDVPGKLSGLVAMHDAGSLTDNEFFAAKQQVLGLSQE
jgi:hypothetical protein